jgi:hypothetical protein
MQNVQDLNAKQKQLTDQSSHISSSFLHFLNKELHALQIQNKETSRKTCPSATLSIMTLT